jgi:hypothetical protein
MGRGKPKPVHHLPLIAAHDSPRCRKLDCPGTGQLAQKRQLMNEMLWRCDVGKHFLEGEIAGDNK